MVETEPEGRGVLFVVWGFFGIVLGGLEGFPGSFLVQPDGFQLEGFYDLLEVWHEDVFSLLLNNEDEVFP